jgi:hypothetical protein
MPTYMKQICIGVSRPLAEPKAQLRELMERDFFVFSLRTYEFSINWFLVICLYSRLVINYRGNFSNDSHFQLVNSRVSRHRQELVIQAEVLFPKLIGSRPVIIGKPAAK